MQKYTVNKGATSQIIPFSAYDSSSTTGAKLTGLVYNTASLTAYYSRTGVTGSATAISLVTATKGTYTSSGFIAVDATNMPGDYELHIPNAALATGADSVFIQIKGATNLVPVNIFIELTDVLDLGTDDRVLVSADSHTTGATVPTVTNLTNLPTIPANWLTAAGIASSALDGKGDWNIGKTGYSLSQTFPTNFSDLSITATTGQVALPTATQASIDAIEADTNELQGDWANGGRLDLILDDRASQASVDTVDGIVDSILVDTGTDIPARFDGIEGATFSTGTDSLEALRDRGDAAWVTGAGGTPPQLLQSTTIATLSTQTNFTLTAGSADNNAYNGAVVVVTDSVTSTQKAVGSVSDYVGSTRTVTLTADPAIFTMAAGDSIDIIANASTAPSAAAVRAEIDSNSTQLAAIVADTSELQTNQGNWVTATGFATSSALATAQADLDTITGADGVNLLSATQASIDAIEADTNEIQVDLANGGRLDLIFDAILVDTGTTIPAQITGLNNFDPAADTVVNVTTVSNITNEVQADINRINGVLITGDGSITPFDV
jgi:hypothetical protein